MSHSIQYWKRLLPIVCVTLIVTHQALSQGSSKKPAPAPAGFTHEYARVNGVNIHYVKGGKGSLLVLLHGFGQNWYMWNRLMPELSKRYTVVAPDLRGVGESDKPLNGYDKVTMAEDIHQLVSKLGFTKTYVAAHDVGLMVAYAYASHYPDEVEKLALMDALVPGFEPVWTESARSKWWFTFFKWQTADEIVEGKQREFFTSFYEPGTFKKGSFTPAEQDEFIRAYSVKGALNGAFSWFRAFDQDIKDNLQGTATRLKMPVLALGGDHSNAATLSAQIRLIADQATMITISDSGHWLVQEQTQKVQTALDNFFDK